MFLASPEQWSFFFIMKYNQSKVLFIKYRLEKFNLQAQTDSSWPTYQNWRFPRAISALSPCLRCRWAHVVESTRNAGDPGLVPGSGRSPGEGMGYPLRCSCRENPMERGAWGDTTERLSSQVWAVAALLCPLTVLSQFVLFSVLQSPRTGHKDAIRCISVYLVFRVGRVWADMPWALTCQAGCSRVQALELPLTAGFRRGMCIH